MHGGEEGGLGRRTGNSPRSDDFDVWLETVEGKLKSDLIISFASASVRDEAVKLKGSVNWARVLSRDKERQ